MVTQHGVSHGISGRVQLHITLVSLHARPVNQQGETHTLIGWTCFDGRLARMSVHTLIGWIEMRVNTR